MGIPYLERRSLCWNSRWFEPKCKSDRFNLQYNLKVYMFVRFCLVFIHVLSFLCGVMPNTKEDINILNHIFPRRRPSNTQAIDLYPQNYDSAYDDVAKFINVYIKYTLCISITNICIKCRFLLLGVLFPSGRIYYIPILLFVIQLFWSWGHKVPRGFLFSLSLLLKCVLSHSPRGQYILKIQDQ